MVSDVSVSLGMGDGWMGVGVDGWQGDGVAGEWDDRVDG